MKYNYVYAFINQFKQYVIVDYSQNVNVNKFLQENSISNKKPYNTTSYKKNNICFVEKMYICDKTFWDFLHTQEAKEIFSNMYVELVFEYPF